MNEFSSHRDSEEVDMALRGLLSYRSCGPCEHSSVALTGQAHQVKLWVFAFPRFLLRKQICIHIHISYIHSLHVYGERETHTESTT